MNTLSARPGARPYGLLLIVLGLIALVMSRDIRVRSHMGESDPGPQFLPRLMAGGMAGGGLILVIGSLISRRQRRSPSVAAATEGGGEGTGEIDAAARSGAQQPHALGYYYGQGRFDRGTLDATLLSISLPIYLLLLPLVGFFISTWVYSTAMMIRLRMKPLLAMLLATGMMVLVWVLFVWQFRIVLPRGPSWMPF